MKIGEEARWQCLGMTLYLGISLGDPKVTLAQLPNKAIMPFPSPALLVRVLGNPWLFVEGTGQSLSYEPKSLAMGGQAWHVYQTPQSWGQHVSDTISSYLI